MTWGLFLMDQHSCLWFVSCKKPCRTNAATGFDNSHCQLMPTNHLTIERTLVYKIVAQTLSRFPSWYLQQSLLSDAFQQQGNQLHSGRKRRISCYLAISCFGVNSYWCTPENKDSVKYLAEVNRFSYNLQRSHLHKAMQLFILLPILHEYQSLWDIVKFLKEAWWRQYNWTASFYMRSPTSICVTVFVC